MNSTTMKAGETERHLYNTKYSKLNEKNEFFVLHSMQNSTKKSLISCNFTVLLLLKASQRKAFWDKIKFLCYLHFKINSRAKILLLIGYLHLEISVILQFIAAHVTRGSKNKYNSMAFHLVGVILLWIDLVCQCHLVYFADILIELTYIVV